MRLAVPGPGRLPSEIDPHCRRWLIAGAKKKKKKSELTYGEAEWQTHFFVVLSALVDTFTVAGFLVQQNRGVVFLCGGRWERHREK